MTCLAFKNKSTSMNKPFSLQCIRLAALRLTVCPRENKVCPSNQALAKRQNSCRRRRISPVTCVKKGCETSDSHCKGKQKPKKIDENRNTGELGRKEDVICLIVAK